MKLVTLSSQLNPSPPWSSLPSPLSSLSSHSVLNLVSGSWNTTKSYQQIIDPLVLKTIKY